MTYKHVCDALIVLILYSSSIPAWVWISLPLAQIPVRTQNMLQKKTWPTSRKQKSINMSCLCLFCHIRDDIRSFFGWIRRKHGRSICIKKGQKQCKCPTNKRVCKNDIAAKAAIAFPQIAFFLRIGTNGLWRYYSCEWRGVLWNKGSNFVRNMPSSSVV